MKYLISIILILFSVTVVTSTYAHTNRLHKNRLELLQEKRDRAEAAQLMKQNGFTAQMEKLQALENELAGQQGRDARLKNLSEYLSGLRYSIAAMQQLLDKHGDQASHLVATHGDNAIPVKYQLNMFKQLMQRTLTLQELLLKQWKDRQMDLLNLDP